MLFNTTGGVLCTVYCSTLDLGHTTGDRDFLSYLDVVSSFRLSIHHQETVVQVLLRPPPEEEEAKENEEEENKDTEVLSLQELPVTQKYTHTQSCS